MKSPVVCTTSTVIHFAAIGRSLTEIFKVSEIICSKEVESLSELFRENLYHVGQGKKGYKWHFR
jgi:hypothetical protein